MYKTADPATYPKQHRAGADRLEPLVSLLRKLASSRLLVYGLFSLLYLVPATKVARVKIFWEDEFFTLYLSRIPSWHDLLVALSTGADQHPPSFYYLNHGIMKLFGTSPLTVRLPAIFGFWLLCICLYEIGRHLTDPLWAVVAMLFPLTTNLFMYAAEARGYGPEVGFIALALLSWLKAASGSHRRIFLPLLGLSLAGAVSMHYYAAAVVACLGAGELVRWKQQRTIDVPVAIALACGFLPILAFIKTIQSARGYSGHFWATPAWIDVLNFYQTEVSEPVIAILAIAAVIFFVQTKLRVPQMSASRKPESVEWIASWQATAIGALAALPAIVMVAAKYVTHGFSDRYAIGALVGVTVLLCCVLYRAAPEGYMAIAIAAVSVVLFVSEYRDLLSRVEWDREATGKTMHLLAATGSAPIDMMHVDIFYRLSFYAPRELARRLEYVADPALSVRYLNEDTLDRGLLDLRPWFPLNSITLNEFRSQDADYLAYGEANKWNWMSFELPKFGDAHLLTRDHHAYLFSVKRSASDVLRPAQHDTVPMLYNSVPKTGASICDLYMGGVGCY